jgi:hypothetical protein
MKQCHIHDLRIFADYHPRARRTSPRRSPWVLEPGDKGTGEARKAALLESLRSALPDACHVRFGDDPEHAHGHSLVPGGNGVLIVVDEDWQAALADRCARALGYVAHEI